MGGVSRTLIFPIKFKKQVSISIHWIIKFLKQKSRNINLSFLIDIIISCLNNSGEV